MGGFKFMKASVLWISLQWHLPGCNHFIHLPQPELHLIEKRMCLFQAIKVVNCFYFAVLGLGRRQSSSLGSQAGGLRFSVKPTRSSRMMAPPGTTPRPQHRKTSIFINKSMDVKKSSADNIDQYTGCKNRVGTM